MLLQHTVALCKIKERARAAAEAIFFRVNGPYHVAVKSFPPARYTPGVSICHLSNLLTYLPSHPSLARSILHYDGIQDLFWILVPHKEARITTRLLWLAG